MVIIDKSPLPDGVTITCANDYRSDPVFSLIVEDCRNKCYLCEDNPTGMQVEHRVSHRGDHVRQYDWNNLFLSCFHCNKTKGAAFDDIIDPVNVDPEEYIELAISATDDLRKKVVVQKSADSDYREDIDATVRLLERIYNGGTTMMDAECRNLKKRILDEINKFQLYIKGYMEENNPDYFKVIADEISRVSVFAAFKRKMVRDDPELAIQFAEALR